MIKTKLKRINYKKCLEKNALKNLDNWSRVGSIFFRCKDKPKYLIGLVSHGICFCFNVDRNACDSDIWFTTFDYIISTKMDNVKEEYYDRMDARLIEAIVQTWFKSPERIVKFKYKRDIKKALANLD